MKFGPVYIEAEGVYGFGEEIGWIRRQRPVSPVRAGHLSAWQGRHRAGVCGRYLCLHGGDDPTTADKREGTFAAALLAGQAWDPCLILWNDGLYGGSHRRVDNGLSVFFDNAWLFQVYGGFKPVKQADIMLSFTWVKADQNVVANQVSKEMGYEIDLVGKYKIFDNLEYMIGAGYHIVGDYFKMADSNRSIDNNYMLIHKLTLSF